MSSEMASPTLTDFEADDATPAFPTRDWVREATEMDADEFDALDRDEKQHVLWEMSRDIPFKYARHSAHGKMRQFLAGAVINRCKVPTVLFETVPSLTEFRQKKGRAQCSYRGGKSTIRVDFHAYSTSSDYGVTEADVQHELLHAMLRANDIHMSRKAFYRGDGRTDRAWFYNGGFPNWDFGGADVPADAYLHRDGDRSGDALVSHKMLDGMLANRIDAYEADGLYEGADDDHGRDGRPDPFADDVRLKEADSDLTAFKALVLEANIAWYTTAKAFSEGYEELARHSIFWENYSATNPEEMLAKFHEFFQKPGAFAGTHAIVAQARHRHPWLLKRYLDCFEPHPDKAAAVDALR